jgi:hypothetical protein
MFHKCNLNNLRNADHYMFIYSACAILRKYNISIEFILKLIERLEALCKEEEEAFTFEKTIAKVREKDEADRYRDNLHRRFFNYVKSILYDKQDPHFDDAQAVMEVLKSVGNPTQLPENVESTLLIALGNKLEACSASVAAIGAKPMLDALLTANRKFMGLEQETREMTFVKKANQQSVTAVRKKVDPVYRAIVGIINGLIELPEEKEAFKDLISEMNILIAKYELLILARKNAQADKTDENKTDENPQPATNE